MDTAVPPFELTDLDPTDLAEQGLWLEVPDPRTKTPIPGLALLIASYDSEHAKEQKRKLQKKRAKLGRPVTPEEIEEDALSIVASVVLDWRGLVWRGEPLPCTTANKVMILGRLDWLRRWVDASASEPTAFFPPSANSSQNTSRTSSDSPSVPPAPP